MPQYMLLIYGPAEGGPSPEEMAAQMPQLVRVHPGPARAPACSSPAIRCTASDAATTVRVRDGETQITDGPFAETKEILGGYYIIDARDLDTALEHAARVPNVQLRLDRGAPDHGHERDARAQPSRRKHRHDGA